ncbi:hypothetical protein ACS0TY_028193 [Phlomoides rotata]
MRFNTVQQTLKFPFTRTQLRNQRRTRRRRRPRRKVEVLLFLNLDSFLSSLPDSYDPRRTEVLDERRPISGTIIAMARICRRKTEVLLVVEEIILEIVFMVSVIINRYRNTSQFRGLNVENVRRYRMAD